MPTAAMQVSLMTILLSCPCLTQAKSPDWGTVVTKNKTTDPSYNNEAAPSDTYSMFKQLMEVKEDIAGEKEQEPKVVKTLKFALKSLFEAAYKGFIDGFLPHVDRQRREATDDSRSFLDIAIGAIGALMGKQGCSEKIACRTGKYFGQKVPGASLAVMMIEGIVPKSLSSWFRVVKTAVIDRSDNCDEEYACSLVEEESNETV